MNQQWEPRPRPWSQVRDRILDPRLDCRLQLDDCQGQGKGAPDPKPRPDEST